MSDETPEINSAELEAEEILKEALSKVDMDGEDCPQGDLCAIHHRNDEEVLDNQSEYGRIITYVGEYAVLTSDNPALLSPSFMLKMIFGGVSKDEIPPMYETCVMHVGDGSIADLRKLDSVDRSNSIRFIQTHDDWSNFRGAHDAIVDGVREGLIDVSKPAISLEG